MALKTTINFQMDLSCISTKYCCPVTHSIFLNRQLAFKRTTFKSIKTSVFSINMFRIYTYNDLRILIFNNYLPRLLGYFKFIKTRGLSKCKLIIQLQS